jgi:hypothetical protein
MHISYQTIPLDIRVWARAIIGELYSYVGSETGEAVAAGCRRVRARVVWATVSAK